MPTFWPIHSTYNKIVAHLRVPHREPQRRLVQYNARISSIFKVLFSPGNVSQHELVQRHNGTVDPHLLVYYTGLYIDDDIASIHYFTGWRRKSRLRHWPATSHASLQHMLFVLSFPPPCRSAHKPLHSIISPPFGTSYSNSHACMIPTKHVCLISHRICFSRRMHHRQQQFLEKCYKQVNCKFDREWQPLMLSFASCVKRRARLFCFIYGIWP